MEDMVIPDIMNYVFLPQGRYPENFMLISQWKVCQEGGVKKGGTWRTLSVPDQSQEWGFKMECTQRMFRVPDCIMEDGIILDGMNEVFLSYGRYPEKIVLIS